MNVRVPAAVSLWLSLAVSSFAADGPLFRWQFNAEQVRQSRVMPTAGRVPLSLPDKPQFDVLPPQALVFDESRGRQFVEAKLDLKELALPAKALTASAWVRVDKPLEWGGLFGIIQDNGNYERGWLLGYRQSRFFFALVSQATKRVTYLTAPDEFEPGHWYHVAGTWDGQTQHLFVDGKLAASSKAQRGPVAYPEDGHFGVGAYWDSSEYHALTGQIEQVSLWDRPLTADELGKLFDSRKARFPGIEGTLPQVTDWPTHLRDNQRTGIAHDVALKFPLHQQWVFRAGKQPAPAWPPPANQDFWHKKTKLKPRVTFDRAFPMVAVGGSVFFASSAEDYVACLDHVTGDMRWQFFTEAPVRLAPTFHKGRLLFGSDDGCVYCVDAADGSLLWKYRAVSEDRRIPGNGRVMSVWPIRTGILVDDDKAIFCAGLFPQQGVFQIAVDVGTGRPVARTPLTVSAQGYLERRGSRLHVATGRDPAGAFVSRLSRRGKSLSLKTASIPVEYPYAFIGDAKSRFAGGDGRVAAFEARTGDPVWEAEVQGRAYSLAIANSSLLVSTDQGEIHCFANAPEADTVLDAGRRPSRASSSGAERQQTGALAQRAIAAVDPPRGWALILNAGDGGLAAEIARQSELNVIGVEADPAQVRTARKRLYDAGLSGRVSMHQASADGSLPYTDYLFNVVVDQARVEGRSSLFPEAEVKRVTRPNGGTAFLGMNNVFERGALPGVADWTHQYADPGNTACSGDNRVTGKMQLQWFGAPGPRFLMDRHHRPAAPVCVDGRMIIPGNNRVIAADAYNGAPLWSIDVPESRRAGVYRDSSWLAARDESVYVAAAARCLRLDASTGKLQTSYSIPGVDSTVSVEWGYVAVIGKQLFGSRQRKGASRREHSLEQINEGTYYDARPLVCSDELFSLAAGNGETKWRYAPESGVIVNSTIAVADDRVYLIESSGLPAKVSKTGRYRASELFRETEKLTALNMKSGDVLWQELLDLSRLEHVVYLCAVDNRVVLAGSYNRRIGKQPTVHFDISVHDGSTGNRLWSKTQNQGTKAGGAHGEQDLHPVIVGDTLFCEPFAYSLSTGTPLADWKWNRNHRRGCGTVSASATSFFFRHANPTMFDLTGQEYLKITTCTRPGCWINMIPAGGLLLVPEGSSGCTCHYAVQSSMAFLPAGGE